MCSHLMDSLVPYLHGCMLFYTFSHFVIFGIYDVLLFVF